MTQVLIRGSGYAFIYLSLILHEAITHAFTSDRTRCLPERKETQSIQLDQLYGKIQTTNYPGVCPPNQLLLWLINSPPQWQLYIRIHGFHIYTPDFSGGCTYGNLTIYNSKTCAVVFGPKCGKISPQKLKLPTSNIMIAISSGRFICSFSFLMTFWTTSPYGSAIPLQHTNSTLMSPFLFTGLGYPTDFFAIWNLKVSQAMIVLLDFEQFRLELSGPNCEYDYLSVRDGSTLSSPLLGKYCGIHNKFTIQSKSSSIIVHFFSDSTHNENGFYARFRAVRYDLFQTISSIPTFNASSGVFNATTPTYLSVEHAIYVWKIITSLKNLIKLKWTYGKMISKPSFFMIHEEPNFHHNADYLEINSPISEDLMAAYPIWLRDLLDSNLTSQETMRQWNSSGNNVLIILGVNHSTSSLFMGEYLTHRISPSESSRCIGPLGDRIMVNRTTIIETQLLGHKQGSVGMAYCKWTFQSMPKLSIKVLVHSISNPFANTKKCEYGGLKLYEISASNINQSKEIGPFCRKTGKHQIYTPTVSTFVSTSSSLVILMYGHNGMDIKVNVTEADCQGIIPELRNDGGTDNRSLSFTLDVPNSPLCYHVNGFVSTVSYNLTFHVPDASAFFIIIEQSQSAVKKDCQHQVMISGCGNSNIQVAPTALLKLPCSSIIAKSIQIRYYNTCPWAQSYWYAKLKSKINVDCVTEHPNCFLDKQGFCGEILLPLSGVISDFQKESKTCFVHIHGYVGNTFFRMAYYEIRFQKNAIENCNRKKVTVEEYIVRSTTHSYGSHSMRKQTFSTCVLTSGEMIVRTMTVDGFKIHVSKDDIYASNKGNIFMMFKTLVHHIYQLPVMHQTCPHGFQYIKENCYYYGQPDVESQMDKKYRGTWMDANSECQNRNASLLTIANKEEMTAIKELMSSVWARRMFNFPSIYIYIGLHDQSKVGALQSIYIYIYIGLLDQSKVGIILSLSDKSYFQLL